MTLEDMKIVLFGRNNLSNKFNVNDKNYYKRFLCVADNGVYSAEDRDRYVLFETM